MNDVQQIWLELNSDLQKYVCTKVNHEDHCHDILHDVYLKLVANVQKVSTVDNVKAYLVRIASNTIADHYRARPNQHTAATDLLEDVPSDCSCAQVTLSESFLERSIAQLPEKYREAFIKVELQGMTQKEYADSTGISLSGAKSRVQRAREQLKEVILDCCNYQFDRYGNIIKCCGEDVD